jgi:hypothetical protein
LGVLALNLIDQLEFEIQSVLQKPSYPVISGKYFASRETGLATGLSGLSLSLGQNLWKPIVGISDSMHSDIFSCKLFFEMDSVAILSHDKVNTPFKPDLGDIFTGICNTTWSEMVLNLPFSNHDFEDNPGSVIRRGIAHGDLIRDFVKWLRDPNRMNQNVATSENVFEMKGWCNGNSGFLIVSALRQIYSGVEIQRDFFENEFRIQIRNKTCRFGEHGFPEKKFETNLFEVLNQHICVQNRLFATTIGIERPINKTNVQTATTLEQSKLVSQRVFEMSVLIRERLGSCFFGNNTHQGTIGV